MNFHFKTCVIRLFSRWVVPALRRLKRLLGLSVLSILLNFIWDLGSGFTLLRRVRLSLRTLICLISCAGLEVRVGRRLGLREIRRPDLRRLQLIRRSNKGVRPFPSKVFLCPMVSASYNWFPRLFRGRSLCEDCWFLRDNLNIINTAVSLRLLKVSIVWRRQRHRCIRPRRVMGLPEGVSRKVRLSPLLDAAKADRSGWCNSLSDCKGVRKRSRAMRTWLLHR